MLDLFLAFVVNFNVTIAHNMCVLQPNPCFKGLQCIMEYVGGDNMVTDALPNHGVKPI